METTPPEQAGGAVQGYSRADVDQYLMAAAAERSRLEGAIGAAYERQRRADAAAAASLETAALVHAQLQNVQRELAQTRLQVEAEVEAIVGRAREQAAQILRGARSQAHALLEPTGATSEPPPAVPVPAEAAAQPEPPAPPEPPVSPPPVPAAAAPPAAAPTPTSEPPAPPVAPPVDHYSFESALSTLTWPEPVPETETPDIDLTVEDAFWDTPAAVAAHNDTARNGSSSNGASSNGDSSNGSSNGHASSLGDSAAADGSESRPANGFATLLRRARTAWPAEAGYTEEDDAFFDFLRGALDDDAPLGPRASVDGDQTP